MKYSTIVLGLGAMGSAAIYHLAKRGQRVLGLDRLAPPHTHGSTHGETRITRQAIGEGEQYSPLSLRSYELWREIERATGEDLLSITGGLIISSPTESARNNVADFFGNTVRSAQRYRIAHEILPAPAMRKRFPQFSVHDDELGYYEPNAGFLRPEACVRAQLALAARHGAELHVNETAVSFTQRGAEVVVTTTQGDYTADHLVVTAGPWLPELIEAQYGPLFAVRRQVLFWFDPKSDGAEFLPGKFPVFIWEPKGAPQALYGFPTADAIGGVKVASGQYRTLTTPATIRREVDAGEIAWMHRVLVAPCLPGLSDRCRHTATCMYTITPDYGFVIDTHPRHSRVLLASACSGHGFKHSAAVGESLAERVVDGRTKIDLSGFTLGRFAPSR